VDKRLEQVWYNLPLNHAYAVDCHAELLVAVFWVINSCLPVLINLHVVCLLGREPHRLPGNG